LGPPAIKNQLIKLPQSRDYFEIIQRGGISCGLALLAGSPQSDQTGIQSVAELIFFRAKN
jgi:hypothetical protein